MCLRSAFAVLFLASAASLWAQTNPPAQPLPYDQNFNSLPHTSSTYPAGWRGWVLATTAPPDYRINPPTGNVSLMAPQTAASTAGGVKNYNGKLGFQVNASLDCAMVLAVNTTGHVNVPVSYTVMTLRNPYNGTTDTRIQETSLQYRVGTAGIFTTLSGIDYQNNTTQQLTGTVPQNAALRTVTLPAACNNQPVVQLRWVMREVSGSGQRPSFAVDDVHVGPPCVPIITYPFASYCVNNSASTPSVNGLAGGTFSSTAGLSINASSGEITPATSTPGSYVVHYQVVATGSCAASDGTTSVTILPAPIAIAGGPYTGCSTAPVSISATTNGTGTWSGGAGTFASATSPSTTYTPTAGETGTTVTLTWTTNDPDGGGACSGTSSNASLFVGIPNAARAHGPYRSDGPAVVPINVTSGVAGTWSGGSGTFAAPTSPSTTYTLGAGEAGTSFTLTWTNNNAGTCAVAASTAQFVAGGFGGGNGRGDVALLSPCPSATISYASTSYCVSSGTAAPTITGNGSGTFSSTAGLSINAGTGVITPATSTPGNYVVTYAIPATPFCAAVNATFNVSITTVPTANAGGPYFSGGAATITVTAAANGAGTWSGGTGSFASATSTTTTYTLGGGEAGTAFSLTWTTNAATGCTPAVSNAQVVGGGFGGGIGRGDVTTPTACPAATIAYASAAYCVSNPTVAPTITGSIGGAFSSTAGLSINASTGVITPATSTPGNYVVTYAIPATPFCAAVNATFNVSITTVPTANAGGPYFSGGPATITVVAAANGPGTWSGGTGSFASATSTTTTYTLGGGEAGTAFSLTWTTNAATGCTPAVSTAQVVGGGFGGGIGRGDVSRSTNCPAATIAYSSNSYCVSSAPATPTITGTTGGTFSSTAGLAINASTGVITPASSTAGNYVVTYSIPGSIGCPVVSATFNVSITPVPTANAGGPYFSGGAATITVVATANGAGTWSGGTGVFASPTSTTTSYTLGGGEAGTAFTITWTTPSGGACSSAISNAQVVGGGFGGGIGRGDVTTPTACPAATIAYASAAYCVSNPTVAPTITGSIGGTFSSTAGLTINTGTGVITPATSTPGNYVVTYIIPATPFCAAVNATFNVSITPVPTANAGGPYFSGGAATITVVAAANGAGTWSGGTGSFASATSTTTTYTLGGGEAGTAFSLTWTTNAGSGCTAAVSTAQVVGGGFGGGIGRGDVALNTPCPTATIAYASTAYCVSSAPASPTITGNGSGTFSSTAGLAINASTGVITPASSTPGNYVVTYTIAATPFCAAVNTTFNVSITPVPTANAGGPYFSGGAATITVVAAANGAGTWSGGTGSFASATSTTTTYTLGGGEAGTAFSLTWTTNAATGCTPAVSNAQVVGGGFGSGIGRGDVAVQFVAPPSIYYSRATGNVTDPIWNLTRTGPPGPAVFSPGTTMVVQIGDVVTNTSTADVYRLRVETGGTLALQGGTAMNVWGDSAAFNGTLNAQDNSAVVLKSLSQVVKLVTTGTPSFFDLQAITPAGTTVHGNVDIRGTLQLDNGAFNANGWFVTLRSAATYTGRLGPVSPLASYVGNMKVERYIPGGATNWRLLGSPIAGKTVQNWQDDFITAGYPGSQFPTFDSPPGSGILWPSIRWYDETNPGPGQNDGLIGVSSNTQPLAQGQGFAAWSGDASGGTAAFIVDVQNGAPHIANTPIALPMSYTNTGNPLVDGWNLVSNPVPSAISFSAISRGANVEDYVTFYNPANGNMAVYDISQGVGTNGASNTIQSSQGFYLKANGPAVTTTVEEADKINDNGGGIFGGLVETLPAMLRLRIASSINAYSDEALITFHEGTPSLEGADVPKLVFGVPEAPQVATQAGGSNLAINAYGEMTNGFTVPVAVNVGVTGTYDLSLIELGEVGLTCISLEDLETGAVTPLNGNDSYSFFENADDDATNPRFLLHATAPFALSTADALCGSDPNGTATVVIGNGTADVTFTNADGTPLLIQNGASGIVTIDGLGAGEYTVQVDGTDACGALAQSFVIAVPPSIEIVATSTPATCGDTPDGMVNVDLLGGTAPYSFLWSNGSTNEDLLAAHGIYSVTVTDANGCVLSSGAYAINHQGPTAGFTSAGTVLMNDPLFFTNTSLNGADFTWDFGDGSTSQEQDPVHAWTVPGIYTVTLTVAANGCSDSWAQPVTVEATTATSTSGGSELVHVWLANDQFVIEHGFNNGLPVLIDLFDSSGRRHRSQQEAGFPGRVLMPARDLATGVWFIRITNDDREHIVRVPLVR